LFGVHARVAWEHDHPFLPKVVVAACPGSPSSLGYQDTYLEAALAEQKKGKNLKKERFDAA
jgi:hypothetical protein